VRNWRVSVRLVALIVIPTTVAAVLVGLRVSSSLADATHFQHTEQLATLGDDMSALTQQLELERDTMAVYNASKHASDGQEVTQAENSVDAATRVVRAAAASVNSSYGSAVFSGVQDMLNRLDKLQDLRTVAATTKLPVNDAIDKYTQFISDLLNIDDLIGQGSSNAELSQNARSLAALARAKAYSSQERALLGAALVTGQFTQSGFQEFQSVRAQRDSELATFQASATPAQIQGYNDTVAGPGVDQAESIRAEAITFASKSADQSVRAVPADDAAAWFPDMTFRADRMRVVEDRLVKSVVNQATDLKNSAQRSALITAGLLLLVLLLVLGATIMVARSLVRPLRRLRAGALDVAGNRLPGLVRRLREPNFVESDFTVEPIDVDTTDEIGEVARAFDEVHREAVRLASNEALLRGNVNAMFVNLSRRSQSLIERQIRLIDNLEQSEQDSERLDSLFKLDHLATRMRRNCENLLVLGGQEQTRRWNNPVPLVDIVRASLSEVEQYERIGLRIQGDVSVVGNAVNDLVHLVAELVENATTFSPEHTKVAVSGHLLAGGGAMLQISDNGLGMSPEELEDANWRLANPPTVDVSVSRRMGLFVVGRLAQRHGVRVELRSALSGGLTTFILLPAQLIMHGDPNAAPPRGIEEQLADGMAGIGHGGDNAFSPGESMPSSVESKLNPIAAGARPQPLGAPTGRFGNPPPETVPYNGGPVDPWENQAPRAAEPPYGGAPEPSYGGTGEFPAVPPSAYDSQPGYEPPYDSQPGYEPQGGFEPHETPPYGNRMPSRGGQDQPVRGAQDRRDNGDPLPRRRPGQSTGGGAPTGPGRGGNSSGSVFSEPASFDRPAMPNLPPLDRAGAAGPRRPAPPARPPNPAPPQGGSFGARRDQNGRPGPGGNSPIFEAMQSEWFQRHRGGPSTGTPQPPPVWSSPGDAGWEAAETIRNPTSGGHTASGLPKRVPGRNHVPGSVASTTPPQPVPVKSPDVVRDRFSNFQQGVRRGRSVTHTEDEQETQ
jgi:signal transduction histidine kinase